MERPLVVYLDSSDWSNLAAAAGSEPFVDRQKWLDIRRRLLAARDAGRAEFRFSQAIVVEAYPTSAAHHADGVARAQTIADLCGPLCLLEANTLTSVEIRKLALGERPPFDRAIALRDDGAWYSDPEEMSARLGLELLLEVRTMVRNLLKEDFSTLGKRERRQAEDMLVDRRGQLTGWARERLLDPSVIPQVQRMAAARLGLPDDAPNLDILARVMAGELPPAAADAWVISLLCDLPILFSLVPTRERAEQLFGYLRVAGRNIAEPIAELAAKMEKFVSEFGLKSARRLYSEHPLLDKERWRAGVRAKLLSRFWEEERKRRGPGPRVRGETWFNRVDGSLFGSIPTLDAYLAASAALMAKAATMSRQPYRGRESDAGDVLHMSYLPYLDVLRCDGGNAQVAQAVISELKFSARVAPTIDDLLKLLVV